MQRCILACRNCQIQMPRNHPCALCCYDCEQICNFNLNVEVNNILLDISLLDLCINACSLCILECSKHMAHHYVCQECVDACKACIIKCQKAKMEVLQETS